MGTDRSIKKRFVYDFYENWCKEIDAVGMATVERDEECIGTLHAYNYVGWLVEKWVP